MCLYYIAWLYGPRQDVEKGAGSFLVLKVLVTAQYRFFLDEFLKGLMIPCPPKNESCNLPLFGGPFELLSQRQVTAQSLFNLESSIFLKGLASWVPRVV